MSTIKLRRSATSGKVPTTAQLELGELAINTFDGRVYMKKNQSGTESIVRFGALISGEDTIKVDTFTGNGSNTEFTISESPQTDQHAFVTINGVSQHIDTYSLSGTTLTFDEAPLSTDAIEVRTYNQNVSEVALQNRRVYVFTISNSTDVSGNDDDGTALTFESDLVEVYANGAKLVGGSDYTTGTNTITLTQAITGTVEVVSVARASFLDGIARTDTSALTTTTADQVVDSFSLATFRTAKYIVQMQNGSNYSVAEVLLVHDGTTVYTTEYARIDTSSSLGTIDADISSGLVRLLVTPTNTNTTIKAQRQTVTT